MLITCLLVLASIIVTAKLVSRKYKTSQLAEPSREDLLRRFAKDISDGVEGYEIKYGQLFTPNSGNHSLYYNDCSLMPGAGLVIEAFRVRSTQKFWDDKE